MTEYVQYGDQDALVAEPPEFQEWWPAEYVNSSVPGSPEFETRVLEQGWLAAVAVDSPIKAITEYFTSIDRRTTIKENKIGLLMLTA